MFEKIKDFLYDISDIVISILIISLLFLAVTWKIGDTFKAEFTDTDVVIIASNETKTTIPTQTSLPTETTIHTTLAPSTENTNPSTDNALETTTLSTTQTTTVVSTQALQTTIAPLRQFTVEAGQTGYSIAVSLQNQGFILDANAFLKRATDLGLDSKLMSGTFYISPSDPTDTIIRVLTGGQR